MLWVARTGFIFKVPAYSMACKTKDQVRICGPNIRVEVHQLESYRKSLLGLSLEIEYFGLRLLQNCMEMERTWY